MLSLIINLLAIAICGTLGLFLLNDGKASAACFQFFLVGMNFTCALYILRRMMGDK